MHRTGPTTARLRHRAFEPSDAAAFLTLRSDPEIIRYTCDERLEDVAEAERAIRAYPDFDQVGYGRWACVLRDDDRVVGFSGLKYLPELDAVDLGYRFLPDVWGRGLATESGRACVAFGFEVLGLDEIIALVLPDNRPSVRVLTKLGFGQVDEIDFDGQSGVLRFLVRR